MEKRVTFKKIHGILFLCGAIFILGASFITGPSINTITGILILVIAILYLTNPAVVYNDDEMQQKNLFGITMKTYSFKNDKFSVQDDTIYVNGSKVRLSKSMLVTAEFDELLDHIRTKSGDSDMSGKKPQSKTDDNILDSEMIGQ